MYTLTQRAKPGAAWRKPESLTDLQYALLCARGISSAEEANAFLHPLDAPLCDPMRMRGMPEATEILREEIRCGGRICVYGDYDVDGVSACAILTGALRTLGADVFSRIPSRASEGYGLNENAVREIRALGATLLLTVDCGISDAACVSLAKEIGMRVIVTDHHRADEANLPECVVVTAYGGEYPCPHLCGAGVAYKLACALEPEFEDEYIDLAALATVADIVPLLGENRTIVARGIRKINAFARPGIAALLREAGVSEKPVTEDTLGFQLSPRLNAGGRLGSAERSYNLLCAKSEAEAKPLAAELESENTNRRQQETAILRDAREQLRRFDFIENRAIVLSGKNWNAGVIGIVASRLTDEFHYPVILLSEKDGEMKGSARSIPGVDIYLALKACSEHLLRFGGHTAAAGLSLASENFELFRAALNAYLRAAVPPETYVPAYEYDAALSPEDMTLDACEELDALRPFGMGNPQPVFLARFSPSDPRRMGADGRHLRFRMDGRDGSVVNAVWFGHGDVADELDGGERAALCSLQKNEFLGRVSAQCLLSRLLPEKPESLLHRAGKCVSHAFLTSILYTDSQKADGNEVSLAECAELLRRNPQGISFTALTSEAAEAFLREMRLLGAPEIDVCAGRWTDGAQCFSSLCVCPEGAPPESIKAVVALDMPPETLFALAPNMRALYLEDLEYEDGWPETLPDTDALREIYTAARRVAARPFHAEDVLAIAGQIAREANQAQHAALAGLLALCDMRLVTIAKNPLRICVPAPIKTRPEENRVYRNIARLRERRRRA